MSHTTSFTNSPTIDNIYISISDDNATTSECVRLSLSSLKICSQRDTVMSQASRAWMEDVMYIGLLPLLAVVGVLTNVINCVVFNAQGLKDRVNMCLFCLCLADIVFLSTVSIRFMNKTLTYVIDKKWAREVWVTSLVRFRLVALPTSFALVSNFVSMVIAVERCVCVTWPLRAARLLKTKFLAAFIVVFSTLVIAGMQVVSFKYDIACAVFIGLEHLPPEVMVLPSQLYQDNQVLLDVLDTIIFSSLVPTFSLVVVAVATTITAVKLRQAGNWRQHASGGGGGERESKGKEGGANTGSGADVINRKEAVLTRMLVAMSCVYIACVSPRVLRSLCRLLVPGFRAWGSMCNLMIATESLETMFLGINSSLNFFLFYSMGSRYRATLRRLLTRRTDNAESAKPVTTISRAYSSE
ncbi:hypothetical protein V1264_002040 [Littorina saxatilis]